MRTEAQHKRLQEASDRLRSHLKGRGLRSTRQRDAVLEAFLDADAHVSVEEFYDRIRVTHPHIGHAPVYRCVSLFVEAWIAKERRFHEGKVRYEPGMDASHHDHLVCLACGRIEEFEDSTIERSQEEIAGSHRLELYGFCPSCSRDRLRVFFS